MSIKSIKYTESINNIFGAYVSLILVLTISLVLYIELEDFVDNLVLYKFTYNNDYDN